MYDLKNHTFLKKVRLLIMLVS